MNKTILVSALAVLSALSLCGQSDGDTPLRNKMRQKGDEITSDGTNPVRLPVCPDGQIRIADSTQPLGSRCATPTSGSGTVTSVAETVPSWLSIAGGPITTSGTLAITPAPGQTPHQVIGTCGSATTFGPCALVAADIPTLNQDTTGTAANLSGTPALPNGVTATTQAASDNSNKLATTSYVDSGLTASRLTRRVCTIDNDTQSTTALTAGQFSGGCEVPYASTIVEVDVWGGTGTAGGTVTTTGTSSINLQKYTPNGGSTTTILSGALATSSGYACALASTSGTCINGTTSSGSVTISTTSLSAGDWVRVSAATPDATQTWYRISVIYTVN